jgi:hypothetical protein
MYLHFPVSKKFYWTSIERLPVFACIRHCFTRQDFNFEQVVHVMAKVINSVWLAAQPVRSSSAGLFSACIQLLRLAGYVEVLERY